MGALRGFGGLCKSFKRIFIVRNSEVFWERPNFIALHEFGDNRKFLSQHFDL